jgi:hypothetical protein
MPGCWSGSTPPSAPSGSVSAAQLFALGESVGVGAGLDDGAAEGDPVDDGGAQARVSESLGPAAEGLIGGDRDRGLLLAFGEYVEQQFRAAPMNSAYASTECWK